MEVPGMDVWSVLTLFCAVKWRLFCLADGPMDINGITAGPNSSEVLPSSRATEEEPSTCHFRLPRLSSFQSPSLLHVIGTYRSSRSCLDVYFCFLSVADSSCRRFVCSYSFYSTSALRARCWPPAASGFTATPAAPLTPLNLVVGLNMFPLIP